MRDVTVGIKAFVRVAVLEQALMSLEGRNFARVVIADDSPPSAQRRELYRRFESRLPLQVLQLPFGSGVAYGRNRLVEVCDTPYFLLMDDDHLVSGDITPMRQVLDSRPDLGGVTALENIDGRLSSGCGNLYRFGSLVVHDIGYGPQRGAVHLPTETRYYLYDMISNFTLFRARVFEHVRWDETFLTGREHIDFYLAQQRLGKWRFALTPDCHFLHVAEPDGEVAADYRKFRFDPGTFEAMDRYFRNKWGLERGIAWGLSHRPTGRALKSGLLHALLAFAPRAHRGR